ncbi:dTDP-4-dehydrorhamnose 3,5-epimerase [Simiduia aestuariiviva]|uniref:dTDP-4-dehydrorhamnose 3,5-epimerase n=1 Tax=Simiduia aestuariiviva TaxID=1510459 RepID=A0A839UL47_9GAMM|nr:dTDP-4-dehydrorhamnose 3,5-epimerase [Simiduia aestuariiviva]MBB3168373.1 dTDP-4-dehydrorhamnose 3,5-epimerase [Simiduia aestuariiviva]
MIVLETSISCVKVLSPKVFGDDRGYFMETFRDDWFRENVADVNFVQDNQSSSGKYTLRGLHYQLVQTQGKLVRVISGEVFDVAVDVREGSPTFGHWVGEYLSAENRKQLWVPPGFAHGFMVTSDEAEFVYKCTDYYHPDSEVSIAWNDPLLAIDWPIPDSTNPVVSEKDELGCSLAAAPSFPYEKA